MRAMSKSIACWAAAALAAACGAAAASASGEADLRALAAQYRAVHRYSTLFTAQNVRDYLATEAGIERAIDWCRRTAVTKVYLESFRDGFLCPRALLERAKKRFLEAGFDVCGCVTTTGVGKRSNHWRVISCYTDPATQDRLAEIFRYTASLFDEIMIDDFWFTDCTCEACDAARRNRRVRVGDKTWTAPDDTWEGYRGELMFRLSQERVLKPAKAVNPRVRVIVKYPQWYDRFHERGYDVGRETAIFDKIWVGTETRDYNDPRWGGTVQYEAFFIMRWLGGIGGAKCGGGWFDWLGTTPKTYIEQARQTILGGARESMLFCYGGLQRDSGPEDVKALRRNLPELFRVAAEVRKRRLRGVAFYKPINSHPENEARVFDFAGMLGIPGAPTHLFPTNAPAAFFSVHALKDPGFELKFRAFLDAGKPALITDGLARRLRRRGVKLPSGQVRILPVRGDPKRLLNLSQEELDALREPLLDPLGVAFRAPNKTALYLFNDDSVVVENFNDRPVQVRLQGASFTVPARGWRCEWR